MKGLDFFLTLLIPAFVLLHLFLAPYTKVEESFNIQAAHDVIYHGILTQKVSDALAARYDHVSFPGVVPRSFVGAVVLAGLSKPWIGFLRDPSQVQLLVRAILGLCNAASLLYLRRAVDRTYGQIAGRWFILLQASQFHVIHYASRTLPNMFAFGLTTLALARLLLASSSSTTSSNIIRHQRLALYLITVADVIFRSELAILLFSITAYLLIRQRTSLTRVVIPAGLSGATMGLLVSVPIDSYFWSPHQESFSILWPELSGLYFNTVLGKSSDWGTSPWYFYVANALPKLLLNPLTWALCIPTALSAPGTRQQSIDMSVPLLSFVALYSFLAHKEWRFIVYVVPGLTAVAAAGAGWIWNRRSKSFVYRILSLALIGSVTASFAASSGLLLISSMNYPGGVALQRLHQLAGDEAGVQRVYLDNLSCQTGVTRFLEIKPSMGLQNAPKGEVPTTWIYDKTEDETQLLDPMFWEKFDYVLAERPDKVIGKWETMDVVYAFTGVGIVRPGDEGNSAEEGALPAMEHGQVAKRSLISELWGSVERLAREKVTRALGYGIKVKMEPRIKILKTQDVEAGVV